MEVATINITSGVFYSSTNVQLLSIKYMSPKRALAIPFIIALLRLHLIVYNYLPKLH